MDNGYALSLNLTIWVGAEMQKMMEGHPGPADPSGQQLLDAANSGDVRGRAGPADQGAALWTLDYPQARRDRGHAGGAQELAHVPEKWEPDFPIRTCAKPRDLERIRIQSNRDAL